MPTELWLVNGRTPESISNKITPSAYKSARPSTFWPRACSGDMYSGVPKTMPAFVIGFPGFVPVGNFAEVRLARDVRVLDVRRRHRLALEARDDLGHERQLAMQHLDRATLAHQHVLGRVRSEEH